MIRRTHSMSTLLGPLVACLLALFPINAWSQEGLFFSELDAHDMWRTMPNQLAVGPLTLGMTGTLGGAVHMGPHQESSGFLEGIQ